MDAGHKRPSGCRRAVGCFGLLVAVILTMFFLPPQISRFTVGDLTPVPQPMVADEVNGWVALQPVLAKIQGTAPEDLYVGVAEGRMAAETRAWVKQNAALLPLIDKALARPEFSYPRPDQIPLATDFDGLRQAVRLGCAAAMADAEEGRRAAATARFTNLVRATDRLMTCEASLVVYLVAVAGQAITLRGIQRTVAAQAVAEDWELWQPLFVALQAVPDQEQAIAGAFRGEWAATRGTVLRKGDVDEGQSSDEGIPAWLLPCPVWDPWRTLADYRGDLDQVASVVGRARTDRTLPELQAFAAEPMTWTEYNALGNALRKAWLPVLVRTLDKSDQTVAERRLTFTTLALRLAHDRSGKLPASLAALVKDGLLDAVPIDPFDGQPLRYDPARRVLWSVNRDGNDDRGSWAKASGGGTRDLAVALEFSAP